MMTVTPELIMENSEFMKFIMIDAVPIAPAAVGVNLLRRTEFTVPISILSADSRKMGIIRLRRVILLPSSSMNWVSDLSMVNSFLIFSFMGIPGTFHPRPEKNRLAVPGNTVSPVQLQKRRLAVAGQRIERDGQDRQIQQSYRKSSERIGNIAVLHASVSFPQHAV